MFLNGRGAIYTHTFLFMNQLLMIVSNFNIPPSGG
jgi:hypothetical protein